MSSTSGDRGERRVPAIHIATMVIVPIAASIPGIRADVAVNIRYATCAMLVAIGVALMGWTLLVLRGATRPRISPISPALVTSGPFRLVRHPFYLGIAIVLFGTVAKVASGIGLAAFLFLHVPITLWRVRLENRALEAKFGAAWRAYRPLIRV